MTHPEGARRNYEQYHPVSTLLNRLNSRLIIAPWDQLDLTIDTPSRYQHIDARQVTPVEQILSHTGYSTPENPTVRDLRSFDNYRRGKLAGVDTHVGTVELQLEEKLGKGLAETLLFQYRHNPKDGFDNQGNPEVTNDGIANVFLQPDGRIQAFVMLPDTSMLYYPFAPDHVKQNELLYPENIEDAIQKLKQASPNIHPRMLPLLGKLSRLISAASDIWLDRETSSQDMTERLMKISGEIKQYSITRNGIDPELAEKLGAPIDEHPLAGIVDESLIPSIFSIVEMEDYQPFIHSLAEGGYRFPTLFRSHEQGIYFSASSHWDHPDSADTMREILGYNGITDMERGIIIPSVPPDGYDNEWSTRLSFVRHQMMLQVYEDLPEEQRTEMLNRVGKVVNHSVYLRNHTYLTTEVPEMNSESPYAFRNYSRKQQEKIMAGFIAGIMTMNKDLFPYWAGPPLKGDGTKRLDWVPEGVEEVLAENGFDVERIPNSTVHEVGISEVSADGVGMTVDRPYANPDLVIGEGGEIFIKKPVDRAQVTILEGFSLRPPLERLHQDIEDVYGFNLVFPHALEENEGGLGNLELLPESLHDSARRTVAEALQKYPPEYIQALEFDNLKVVSAIGQATGIFSEDVELIGGQARHADRSLYYVYDANSEYKLHHEIRHFADWKFLRYSDTVIWDALNERGIQSYTELDIEAYMKALDSGALGDIKPGFLSHYGSTNGQEDRAVYAQTLFTSPGLLKRRGEADPLVRKKTAYLQELLSEETDGLLDDAWWDFVMNNEHPFANPPIFGQLLSFGYLTNASAYLDALERKARKLGTPTPYVR